jgi:stage IV sporulation protein FB
VLLSEPPQSPYDLRFSLLGIPVRVHPMFWFVGLLLGLSGNQKPAEMLLWMGAVFVSILVHELGHALTAQAFGGEPRITLYAFGGLASYQPARHTTLSQILITAAGPAAGFLFAAAVLAAIKISGHEVQFDWHFRSILPLRYEAFESDRINMLISDLLFINIFWGLVNLLPVYPLDGGQIARELLSLVNRDDALRQSLWLSVIAAGVVAVLAYARLHDYFIALFFAYLAYTNYTALTQVFGRGGGFGRFR